MKVAIYTRVSIDDKGQDPLNQLLELCDLSARQGWAVVREYTDEATAEGTYKTLTYLRRLSYTNVDLRSVITDGGGITSSAGRGPVCARWRRCVRGQHTRLLPDSGCAVVASGHVFFVTSMNNQCMTWMGPMAQLIGNLFVLVA